VYGTGDICEIILNSQPQNSFSLIIDKNSNNWGKTAHGIPIIAPKEIIDRGIHNIIISSYSHGEEIKEGLKRDCAESDINLITLNL
ncbi:hypothetical protein J7L67_03385, partial [bacterium]|nr:hypothetical protein [bacterium]